MAFDFPNSPTVGQVYNNYVWDGEKWTVSSSTYGAVRYDIAQGLTANQQAQGRANIGSLKKNYIINGAMMVSQENGTTAGTAAGYWPVDGFNADFVHGGALSIAQVASRTPGGSPNRVRLTVGTADTSVAAGDYIQFQQSVEGLRAADLNLGLASAKTLTVQFGCKGPAGTYCVAVRNGGFNRAYIAEYVIAAGEANTDVVKSVVIPGDITGTWAIDNSRGLTVGWCLMAGTTYQQTAGAWGAGNLIGSPNQFNFMATAGNIFELFDVSLTEGTTAPPFTVPDYASELALCMRYYEKLQVQLFSTFPAAGNYGYNAWMFKVRKRANPTMTWVGSTFDGSNPATVDGADLYKLSAATCHGVNSSANARL